MKSKKTLALILVLVAVLAGAAFYFLYFIRTPAYALNQARLALKEHNTQKFEQYVDLDSVLNNAFDDIIKAESKINNLSELIIQFSAAKKAKLAAENKPIMERLNQAVHTSTVDLNIFTDNNIKEAEPQKLLLASLSATNKTNVTINRMYYDVTILDEKSKELYSYPEHFRGSIAPGATVQLETSKKLNALLPDDKRLMEMDVSKISGRIQITYIAFDDGNVLSPNTFIE